MASSAATLSSSTASSSSEHPIESRPEAGPLPKKRGELGYKEEIDGTLEEGRRGGSRPDSVLPERHPADRDTPSPPESIPNTDNTSNVSSPPNPPPAPTPDDASSTASFVKPKRKLFGFCRGNKVPSYGGIRLTTFLAFLLQLALLGGTIAAWVTSVLLIGKDPRTKSEDDPDQEPGVSAASSIFVHVIFAIAVLGQLLFFERRVFRLRAERYAFVHPGEILPSARNRRGFVTDAIAFSPWNRPPLPTYAAALAQSGAGTGDVEDHIIAQPPPPAYGNTRGSTFLLAGYLRDSLRAQRPVSAQTQASQQGEGERPKSYTSQDDDWEEIQNAQRARQLEETLARLERPASQTSRRSAGR